MKLKVVFFIALFVLPVSRLSARLVMPHLFGDNMVVQCGEEVKVWGLASGRVAVTVEFAGQVKNTKAARDGYWELVLEPVAAGGPYEMTVSDGSETLVFRNVLAGEVWLCGGQSNMEWWVAVSANADKEIAAADYPEIRSFRVPKRLSLIEEEDTDAGWVVCSPVTAGNFTAVGYFFAREIHRRLGVPVGIIDASWGGTLIEPWTRRESYEALPERVKQPYDPQIVRALNEYPREHPSGDMNYFDYIARDPGMEGRWYGNGTDLSGWEAISVPGLWGGTPLENTDGVVWYKYRFGVPAAMAGEQAAVSLGRVFDRDITWVNGVRVGNCDHSSEPRVYTVPAGVLTEGVNEITVRVIKDAGRGGFPDGADLLWIGSDETRIKLAGDWSCMPTVVNDEFRRANINPHTVYSVLYNGMINPLTRYRIRGTIWYQGESNAFNGYDYRVLFPNLINDWRAQWGYGFPFYWVQLANFTAKDAQPSESQWAEVRESQTMALALPSTGQAVAIDIGEADDIHPRNKQEVGLRLARIALNKTYGYEDVIYSAPVYRSMQREGGSIRLRFDMQGGRWAAVNKYGYIEGFAIAGEDRRFEWAQARIEGEEVVVWSDAVPEPVAVRYAWGTNPDAGLFNTEGLPAGPFRTDDWRLTTEK